MAAYQRPPNAYRFDFGGLKTNDSPDAFDPTKAPIAENVSDALVEYLDLEVAMVMTDYDDAVLDAMDGTWRRLTGEERSLLNSRTIGD